MTTNTQLPLVTKKSLELPYWLCLWLETQGVAAIRDAQSTHAIMDIVIQLALNNFTLCDQINPSSHNETTDNHDPVGGPFAAAVIHRDTQELLGVGVNRVVANRASIAHAEIMALTMAQEKLGHFTLSCVNDRPFVLYTSAQMCAMCCGAVVWSGVSEVIFAATAKDTEALTGFDEGPIHPQWREELERRGIKVTGPIQRKQARLVLQKYHDTGNTIYAR